ncbi:MAG: prepilin-type N-terminal cleavage/methylation domain-containing protein [Clostridium sp.]|uniref:prepilin-type N-terminal cleavage/methylation domain-containing protein n=1 Tax=Clostridium sp. TaxID=1506 RepID=UPI0039EAFDF0
MKRFKKKGFTLIELMIVLAIIAILAIVLIPKAGILKTSAKDTGVTTNVNTVRAFVETKAADNSYLSDSEMLTQITTKFAGDNNIINPLTKVGTINTNTGYDITNTNVSYAIVVSNKTASAAPTTQDITSTTQSNSEGTVFVYVYNNGYVVFGVNSDKQIVNYTVIK